MTCEADDFLWLQNWYCYHCNGDWEHSYGISISNTDTGWNVIVELETSALEGNLFKTIDEKNDSGEDWIHCEVCRNNFVGNSGPLNLCRIFSIFRTWAESLGQKVDTTRMDFHDQSYLM